MNKLTEEQERAVAAKGRIQVLAAGAGSGKTKTLVEKVVLNQEESRVTAGKQIVLTFTNAAADEFRRRLESSGVAIIPRHVGTLHSFALGFLRVILPKVRVIGDREFEEIIRTAFEESSIKGTSIKLGKKIAAGDGKGLLGKNRVARAAIISAMTRENLLHPDMILGLFKTRMNEFDLPKGSFLYIDEFQDSAAPDAAIYRSFLDDFDATIFAVGDPRQAIYSFRGGSVAAFNNLWERSEWRGQLTKNFRSSEIIVDLSNDIAQGMLLPSDLHRTMTTPPKDSVSSIEWRLDFATSEAEAEAIAEKAKEFHEQGRAEDFAVLTRYNANVSMISEVIRAHGVPVNSSLDRQEAAEFLEESEVVKKILKLESIPTSWSDTLIGLDAPKKVRDLLYPILLECLSITDIPHALKEGVMRREKGAVTVSTVHASKGLEWPSVWLSSADAVAFKPEEQEDRRLAYVAITRAKQFLTVSSAKSRQAIRREVNLSPSPIFK